MSRTKVTNTVADRQNELGRMLSNRSNGTMDREERDIFFVHTQMNVPDIYTLTRRERGHLKNPSAGQSLKDVRAFELFTFSFVPKRIQSRFSVVLLIQSSLQRSFLSTDIDRCGTSSLATSLSTGSDCPRDQGKAYLFVSRKWTKFNEK